MLHELVDHGKHGGGDRAQSRSDQDGGLDRPHGPEGGDAGGHVVAVGTPEEIAAKRESYAGQYLKQVLDRRRSRAKRPAETQAAE
jgi:hypothetical protein